MYSSSLWWPMCSTSIFSRLLFSPCLINSPFHSSSVSCSSFSYMPSTIPTSASGTPIHRGVAITISLDTVSNAFCGSNYLPWVVRGTLLRCCHLLLLLYGYYQSRIGLIPRSRGERWGLIKATVCSKILQMFVRY